MSAVLKDEPKLAAMTEADLDAVLAIETAIYTHPWTRGNFADSLRAGYRCCTWRLGGELLGYFMQETIPPDLTPEETIRRLRDQGAAISVSHPFDRLRKGAWREEDLLQIIDKVDAIEVFNARCMFPQDNEKAQAFAEQHHLVGTIGSDAHSHVEYGRALARMQPFEGASDFLESIEKAEFVRRYSSFLVHFHSKTAKWSKKLGLRQRLWEGG